MERDAQEFQGASMKMVVDSSESASLMTPPDDMSDGYGVYAQPWYVDFFGSRTVLILLFGGIALVLAFNAYYLQKKQNNNADSNKSIIVLNAVVAVLVIILAVVLYLTFRPVVGSWEWNQMMMST